MKSTNCTLAAAIWVALVVCPSWAQDATKSSSHATAANEEQSVERAMKLLFDKPGAPLKVAPVSIEGPYAVAGWVQNERGGRALLKKESGRWAIEVCGGDGLTQAASLSMAGVEASLASKLAQKVSIAEKRLPADQIKKLGMFEGVMKVDGGSHQSHASHQK